MHPAQFIRLFALLLSVVCVDAVAQQRLNVVIDATYGTQGRRFVDEVRRNLPADVQSAVLFDVSVISAVDVQPYLQSRDWELAILSTRVLTDAKAKTIAVAFELPYVFTNTESAIAVQESAIGRAALGRMGDQGMTGLVYLNLGMTLIAGKDTPRSLADLKGKKVAVYSPAHRELLQALGSNPSLMRPGDTLQALKMGYVDSAVISSSNPDSWLLFQHKYLLANSVKPQVAVVVTRNGVWDRLPFVYRAALGDAAIAASRNISNTLIQTETSLVRQARSSDISVVTFRRDEAKRATLDWIKNQPQADRSTYSSAFEEFEKIRPQPATPDTQPRSSAGDGRVYFATTRDDTGDKSIRYRFGDGRTNVIKCGQISFDSAAPSATSAVFTDTITTDNDLCGARMNAVLRSSKRVLLFVHGFNNRFVEAAERAMVLKNALGNEAEVLLWSWPSKRDGLVGNYDYDKESVSGIARQRFVHFIRHVRPAAEAGRLDVLAHSMGGWHLVGVLQGLANAEGEPLLTNVALAAPDVPADEFEFALDDMRKVAKRVTLYACERDMALQISQSMNAFRRAGTGGVREIIVSDKLDSIDVEGRFFSTNHSYVFEAGKVLTDLTALFATDSDASVRGLQKNSKPPWHYWSFQ